MANTNSSDKITYSIVGRYMNGSAVSAYHIIGTDGKEIKATRELTCFLVGKGLIINCKGQMNGNDIALRGVGISLTDLPIRNERTGEISNTGSNKNTRDTSIFSQLSIVARLYQDNKCVGYVVRNAGGIERKIDRNTVIRLAIDKKISNARINISNNVPILRGNGIELDRLPILQMSTVVKEDKCDIKDAEKIKIPTVNIDWYTVQKIIREYDSRFIKDSHNNASGVYEYPVLDLINAHSAKMCIKVESDTYCITNVAHGISTEQPEYGLKFTLNGKKDKLNIICNDINYLAFNIHVLGFIGVAALMKYNKCGITFIREFMFENRVSRLLWREYNPKRSEDTASNIKNSIIDINIADLKYFDEVYSLNMSTLSHLGIKKRYPTVSMVANNKAKLIIGTGNGFYEVSRVKYGINNNIGIAIEIKNYTRNVIHVITSKNINMNNININNVSKICCLALNKLENNLEITNIIAENEIEESVLSYDVTRKEQNRH